MKGHKGHHHAKARKDGGKAESPMKGVNEAEMDLNTKGVKYTGGNPIAEAEEMGERKRGGRAKRKHGGNVKHLGGIHGGMGVKHAGRKARKSGGRTGSDVNPFTSARHGTAPKGHDVEPETMG